jgi:hypothetical protein
MLVFSKVHAPPCISSFVNLDSFICFHTKNTYESNLVYWPVILNAGAAWILAGPISPLPTISATSSKFFSTMIMANSVKIRPRRHFGELQSQLCERRAGRRRIELRWPPERNSTGDALAVQRLTEQSARRLFVGFPRALKQPNHDNAMLNNSEQSYPYHY